MSNKQSVGTHVCGEAEKTFHCLCSVKVCETELWAFRLMFIGNWTLSLNVHRRLVPLAKCSPKIGPSVNVHRRFVPPVKCSPEIRPSG